MKWKLRFISILFFCLSAFAYADQAHVGEIRYSILTREQFREKYGEEWDLMKGQSIPEGSALLQLWGKPAVPDARGLFLRCTNSGRASETGNPDEGSDTLGHYMADGFKKHDHGGGNHSHQYHGGTAGGVSFGNHTTSAHNYTYNAAKSSPSGSIIASEGGKETRPRCIIVNAFIKLSDAYPVTSGNQVNSSASVSQTPITPEVMNEITTRPEFREAVENTVREMMNRSNR